MSRKKKNIKVTKLSHKKITKLSPREYTLMNVSPDFVNFNPSLAGDSGLQVFNNGISHKVEKWILIVLLSLAMAAFLGYKLLENSEFSYTLENDKVIQTHGLNTQEDFDSQFNENRAEAQKALAHVRAKQKHPTKKIVAEKSTSTKNNVVTKKKATSNSNKVAAKKSAPKTIQKKTSNNSTKTKKSSLARK
jgi:hypothetical protein